MKRLIALALALACASAIPAGARGIGVGAFGGMSYPVLQEDVGNGTMYGVRVPVNIVPLLSVEPYWASSKLGDKVTSLGGIDYTREGFDESAYGANVMLATGGPVSFYPFAGAGRTPRSSVPASTRPTPRTTWVLASASPRCPSCRSTFAGNCRPSWTVRRRASSATRPPVSRTASSRCPDGGSHDHAQASSRAAAARAPARLVSAGCLFISGQFVVTYDFKSHGYDPLTVTSAAVVAAVPVDLTSVGAYQDHKSDLKDVADLALVGTVQNLDGTQPVAVEVCMGRRCPVPCSRPTPRCAPRAGACWGCSTIPAGATKAIGWNESAGLFGGRQALVDEIKGTGKFDLYVLGNNGYHFKVSNGALIAVISAGK